MVEGSLLSNSGILADYPWSRHAGQVVVDVGGGMGGFLSHLLEAQPNITGVLFDRCVAPKSC
jgi:16S rRNA A1518/A1519 N6-dimethyltransferase RsmA/KsgA/DIM1 with predicted DNA glycosylase/AP lyase activity